MSNGINKTTHNVLTILWATALGISVAVAFGLLSLDKFKQIYKTDLIMFILAIILASYTFILCMAYMIATNMELSILNDYLADVAPRVPLKTYIAIFALAFLFGVLITLSDDILIYAIIFTCYNLFDLWSNWQVLKHIRVMIDNKLLSINNDNERKIIKMIESYYFNNPTIQRITTIMFINFIAVCSSLVFYFTKQAIYRNMAYLIVILNISISEVVIHLWRRKIIYRIPPKKEV